ncbi:MAG: hypothetical protein KC419_17320 [Anaerolineales bacterium]|nr:hypothetical protein [Anaerolineales bacterium]MCA9930249.1 hypothetical protein [Anaerolineales bacterium]
MMTTSPDGFKDEWDGLPPELQQFIKRVYDVAEAVEGDDTPPDIVFEFFELLDETNRQLFWAKVQQAARRNDVK